MDKELMKRNFKKLFFKLRERSEIKSQAEFAEKLGTSRQQMSRIFSDSKKSYPSPAMYRKAVEVFDIDKEFFYQKETEGLQHGEAGPILLKMLHQTDNLSKLYEEKIQRLEKENEELRRKLNKNK